jgi:hypothetical protein
MKKLGNLTLTATVSHRKNNGKIRTLTDATIKLDGKLILATRTLGGKYTAEQALSEFRRFPGKFHSADGIDDATIVNLATHA